MSDHPTRRTAASWTWLLLDFAVALLLVILTALLLVRPASAVPQAGATARPCAPVWIEWSRSVSDTSAWTPYKAHDTHDACERSAIAYPTLSLVLHVCFPDTIDPRPPSPRPR